MKILSISSHLCIKNAHLKENFAPLSQENFEMEPLNDIRTININRKDFE